jgi:hypothetical protein
MDDAAWATRMQELEAKAPVKRKKAADPFVKVPLWWAEAAAKATRTPKALVWIELLRVAWKTKRATFSLPSGRLAKAGVSKDMKGRALRELEVAGLITVERRNGKNPMVTIVVL